MPTPTFRRSTLAAVVGLCLTLSACDSAPPRARSAATGVAGSSASTGSSQLLDQVTPNGSAPRCTMRWCTRQAPTDPAPARASLSQPSPSRAVQPVAASAAPTTPPTSRVPKIAWHGCDEPSQRKRGLQCATVPVPLDHAKPNGPQILLDLARHRASGSRAARKGSLFVNPGGPGGSAINHMDQFLTTLGPSVTSRFDIVAMDPRGVGDSSVAAC